MAVSQFAAAAGDDDDNDVNDDKADSDAVTVCYFAWSSRYHEC